MSIARTPIKLSNLPKGEYFYLGAGLGSQTGYIVRKNLDGSIRVNINNNKLNWPGNRIVYI